MKTTIKGENKMTNEAKTVLKNARELATQNKYQEAKDLLHKNTFLCDLDSQFWTVYQGLSMVYSEKIKEIA